MIIYCIPIIIIFLDQLTKIWVKYYYLASNTERIIIPPDIIIFDFNENSGIAFGFLSDSSNIKPYLDLLTIIILFFLFYLFVKAIKSDSSDKFPLSLIIGGAIGNMIDRILMYFSSLDYQGVVDFIKIGYNGHYWYVFNLADAAISIGVILFFLLEVIKKIKELQYGKENFK